MGAITARGDFLCPTHGCSVAVNAMSIFHLRFFMAARVSHGNTMRYILLCMGCIHGFTLLLCERAIEFSNLTGRRFPPQESYEKRPCFRRDERQRIACVRIFVCVCTVLVCMYMSCDSSAQAFLEGSHDKHPPFFFCSCCTVLPQTIVAENVPGKASTCFCSTQTTVAVAEAGVGTPGAHRAA